MSDIRLKPSTKKVLDVILEIAPFNPKEPIEKLHKKIVNYLTKQNAKANRAGITASLQELEKEKIIKKISSKRISPYLFDRKLATESHISTERKKKGNKEEKNDDFSSLLKRAQIKLEGARKELKIKEDEKIKIENEFSKMKKEIEYLELTIKNATSALNGLYGILP